MIKPTIAELTKGEMNRYELVIAIAKCARRVTDEYVVQRERADLIGKEYRDEKAVKTAISRFYDGRYEVVPASIPAAE